VIGNWLLVIINHLTNYHLTSYHLTNVIRERKESCLRLMLQNKKKNFMKMSL